MTPKGLAANKAIMDQKFSALYRKGTGKSKDPNGGAIYNAAFKAYFDKKYEKLSDMKDPDDPDIYKQMKDSKCLKQDNIDNLIEESHDFASLFADAMKECLDEVANQIDAHIKSMMITVLAPTPGPSGTVLACGVGPVTGTIGANNLSPTGGITIS